MFAIPTLQVILGRKNIRREQTESRKRREREERKREKEKRKKGENLIPNVSVSFIMSQI